jgi:hexosaminidase
VIHWWGSGNPQTSNPVVISNYGPFYLDMGVGNYFGNGYGNYLTWLDLHNQHVSTNPNENLNILGG